MISQIDIQQYEGPSLWRGADFIYLLPHPFLRPFISCYTITIPKDMPDCYTILPSASSTIVVSVSGEKIDIGLRAVNTKSSVVGNHANKNDLLVLIEFRPGCLCPFVREEQSELKDSDCSLQEINIVMNLSLEEALHKATNIKELTAYLDQIFYACFQEGEGRKKVEFMMKLITSNHGNINMKELSENCFYSEKQIRRLFLSYVGASPKTFSRIVRVNYALNLMENMQEPLIHIALESGYFDQPHLINDVKLICGITPNEYLKNMSVFYKDDFKL